MSNQSTAIGTKQGKVLAQDMKQGVADSEWDEQKDTKAHTLDYFVNE